MSQPAIIVEGISKRYRLGHANAKHQTFREMAMEMMAAPFRKLRAAGEAGNEGEEFWALKDVNFEVQPGEVVGIIGRNGAGKSTLLKILSRITEPTTGQIRLRGRVASLLEVGTGFHPELTGRENIYLNGAILGMKRAEITKKFDEIVAFAETEKFLDTPVKFYSSGMYVRLAFAVAAHLEPEILIVDEVLAVGDAEFQKKCLGKMKEVSEGGDRTVLFVSHNMDAVLSLCKHAVVMANGHSSPMMEVSNAVQLYLNGNTSDDDVPLSQRPRFQNHTGIPLIVGFNITSAGQKLKIIKTCDEVSFSIDIEDSSTVTNLEVGIVLTDAHRNRVVAFQSRYNSGLTFPANKPQRLTCYVPSLPLVPGRYQVDVILGDGFQIIERLERVDSLEVIFADVFGTGKIPASGQGVMVLPGQWHSDISPIRTLHVAITSD